jgi:hypothetical protein
VLAISSLAFQVDGTQPAIANHHDRRRDDRLPQLEPHDDDGNEWTERSSARRRRDPRITCSIEAGKTYDQLRGISFEGTAEIVDDPDALWRVGVSVWNRYQGAYSDEVKPLVESMLHNRVAVRVDVSRARTWDHRKLGLPTMPIAGSTAGEPT